MKLFSSKEEYLKNIESYQNREKFLCNVILNRDLYDIEMTEEEQKDNASINNNDLFNNNNFDIDNIPWIISKYVFENNQEHGYRLHKGDIFKLGKYILRVREIGIDDDKKPFFIENKNTQKYIKNRSITINNASQMPLNQAGENFFSALNLNQIINVQRKDDNNNDNDNNENNDNDNNNDNSHSNDNSHNNDNSNNNENEIENGSINNSNNRNKIQIIKNGSENNNSNNNKSHANSNSNSLNNNLNSANNNYKNNFASILHLNPKNNESKNENDNNSQKVISIFYSNNPSSRKPNNSQNNDIISNNGSHNKNNENNNNNNDNGNHFYINIINSSNIENNNILDDSKNRINNNSMNMNSLGFPTFNNNSIFNSSLNNSGKNISKINSFKNNEIENENSKKEINLNNNNNNNSQIIKNSIAALKSTASFKKKKLTEIIQKKILKNSVSITEKNGKPICRICLSEDYEENNPLIHPCNCDGTMKYIHLQCLRLLIQSKIKKTETESCKVFTFKTLECEICKMAFPEKIRIKNSIFSIIDFETPDKDYIILDGLIKETPEEKSIFIVHFKNKKEIKIGRATDANIRLSDISVSRAHAIISQYNESFYLHDTNSKFGTLISAGNKFCILYNKPFSVQKGNILFEFLMKKTFCATLRCYRPSDILYKTYNDFLDETFLYKYQYKDDELLIPEKTKTVSEYSSEAIVKPNQIKVKSSKNFDFFESNVLHINEKKHNNSIQSKEDNKNSSSQSNNNSNYNNKSNENSNNHKCDNSNNNNQHNFFDTFKADIDKINNNVNNYPSIGVNKTQEISNIYQKDEILKSNSKIGISLDNNGNENSLLVNNINNGSNEK